MFDCNCYILTDFSFWEVAPRHNFLCRALDIQQGVTTQYESSFGIFWIFTVTKFFHKKLKKLEASVWTLKDLLVKKRRKGRYGATTMIIQDFLISHWCPSLYFSFLFHSTLRQKRRKKNLRNFYFTPLLPWSPKGCPILAYLGILVYNSDR